MATMVNVRPTRTLAQHLTLIGAFGSRDLKTKFNATALGWLWSLVVPAATLGIYTLIFGGLFRMVPPEIASRHAGIGIFAIWLFAGLIVWGFFQNSINAGINGMVGAGGLLQKVYFPSFAPVLGAGFAIAVQSLIEMALLLVVLLFLGNVSWTWLALPLLLIMLAVFTAGIAVALSIWNIHVRDVAHIVGVVLQLAFYATPIIYNSAIVPEVWHGMPLRWMIESTPMAEFINLFRALTYDLRIGTWQEWGSCLAWTILATGIGVLVYKRSGQQLGEQI